MERIDAALIDRYQRLLDVVRDLRVSSRNRWQIKASEALEEVLTAQGASHQKRQSEAEVTPWSCGLVVAAMYLMQEHQRPRRFASDQGFLFELVRRFRGQTRLAYGSFWNHKTGKRASVYRDVPARVTEAMAQLIVATYGDFAAHVLASHGKDARKRRYSRYNLRKAFNPSLSNQEE